MTAWQFGGFLLCVAVASLLQSMTGFALALILLGLTGLFELAPLGDAANVATVLSIASASIAFRAGHHAIDWSIWRPTVLGGAIGSVIGVALLAWLSANTVMVLRLLLGVAVMTCALVVLLRARLLPSRSPAMAFHATGLLSGILGGLFSASGPPLVYQYYRQPLSLDMLRDTLVATIAFLALLRLLLVVPSGQFGLRSLAMCLAALPVSMSIGWWVRRHAARWPRESILKIVCMLLVMTGIGLIAPPVAVLFGH